MLVSCALGTVDLGHSGAVQAAIDAAGHGVRSVVFRLPQYVWGHGGSFFIPHQMDTARKLRTAYYILPGGHSDSLRTAESCLSC